MDEFIFVVLTVLVFIGIFTMVTKVVDYYWKKRHRKTYEGTLSMEDLCNLITELDNRKNTEISMTELQEIVSRHELQ